MAGPAQVPQGLKPNDAMRLLARRDPAFYAARTLRGPTDPPYNGKFLISEHHQVWSRLVRDHQNLCVQAARGHGKTFFFNLAYPLWRAEQNPGFAQDNYGVIFSGSDPQAQRILTDIKTEVEQNPKLAHLRPNNLTKSWGVKMIQFATGMRLYARGWGSKSRGLHPKFVVLDDVLNDEDGTSAMMRGRNIDYFLGAIKPMLDRPDAQCIVVGTPYHKQDLYGYLEDNPVFKFARFPAILPDGRALWPDKFNIERLSTEEQLMGRVRFVREYMCDPISDGSSIFPMGLFRNDIAEAHDVTLGRGWDWWKARGIKHVFVGVDFAISRNVGADYTSLFVIGLDDNGVRWIMDIIRRRGMSFQDQLNLIKSVAGRYRPDLIAVENNQMQRIFEDELIRTTDLPIKGVHTGREKSALESGIPFIATLLENGKYRIPRGDDASCQQTDVWIEEMHSFTFDKGRVISVGQHDDTAMATFICEKAIKSGLFSFAFGEEDGDDSAYQQIMQGMEVPGLKDEFSDMLPARAGGAFETGDPELDQDLDGFVLSSHGRGRRRKALLTNDAEEGDRPPWQRKRRSPEARAAEDRELNRSPGALELLSMHRGGML